MRAVVAFALIAAAACSPHLATEPIPVTPGTDFDLPRRGVATITGTQLRVTFDSVTNDSRCPTDPGTACVWQGMATVRLTVTSGDQAESIDVPSYPAGTQVMAFGAKFELRGLRPDARHNPPRRQDEYVATLRVASP